MSKEINEYPIKIVEVA